MHFNKAIKHIKTKCNEHQKQASIFLLATIPFMLFMILTHKLVFIEFGIILFGLGLYNTKKIVDLNEEINTIKELSLKLQKNNIKKVYPEGHHWITNPTNAILDLGGYEFIGKDEHGLKIYQNVTDVVVCGQINPQNGEVIYDDFGIPSHYINDSK